jgi:hypothetical protein
MVASHGGSPSGRWLVEGLGPDDVPGRLVSVVAATVDELVLLLAVRLVADLLVLREAAVAPVLRPVVPFFADLDF